jgi:hypothetical protein
MRLQRIFAALLTGVFTTGCTQVYVQGPGGFRNAATFTTLPIVGPRQLSPAWPPTGPYGHEGLYAGEMQVLNSAGARCAQFHRTEGFRVSGRSVAYGAFRGRITDNGSLQMIYGQNWVVGQFGPGLFRGTITYQVPPCRYAMLLRRVAD